MDTARQASATPMVRAMTKPRFMGPSGDVLLHRIGADEIPVDGQAQARPVGNIDTTALHGESFRHQVMHQGIMAQ